MYNTFALEDVQVDPAAAAAAVDSDGKYFRTSEGTESTSSSLSLYGVKSHRPGKYS